jgi:hypothetical protein
MRYERRSSTQHTYDLLFVLHVFCNMFSQYFFLAFFVTSRNCIFAGCYMVVQTRSMESDCCSFRFACCCLIIQRGLLSPTPLPILLETLARQTELYENQTCSYTCPLFSPLFLCMSQNSIAGHSTKTLRVQALH